MNKAELVGSISEKSGLTVRKSELALNQVIGVISAELAAGNAVALVGFGTFKVAEHAARIGTNPKSGKKIELAGKKVPVFKAGSILKAKVNNQEC